MEKGGFMRIFKLEFQKIMKNPMLWLLAVIFCLVNCLIIYNEAGNKDTSKELVIMHDIIKKTDDINHSRQAKNRNERKQLSKAYQEYYKENIDLYDKLDMTKILKQKEEMLQYCQKNNIQLVAWSPIMRGRVFSNELIIGLSEKYKKTIAQIILRWHVQRGVIPIPKSSNKERIKENLNIFDFEISNEDMKIINSLNESDSVSVSGVPDNTTYLKY